MSKHTSDPVQAVKAFLRGRRDLAGSGIAADLRTIRERLARARKVQRGLSLSEALEALRRQG